MRHLGFTLYFVLLIGAGIATGLLVYRSIPQQNTDQNSFDAIIVLGVPANPDGSLGPEQQSRVAEGVREFKRHVAPHVIMTGGAAHNQYVEAVVMARYAQKLGVPADALLEEGQSQNTIQNAWYSAQIMKAHRWTSAEVVSSPSHLPRAALIFAHFPIRWRMHPAPWPATYTTEFETGIYGVEIAKTTYLRLFGFTQSKFLP